MAHVSSHSTQALELSRAFFQEVAGPALQRLCPQVYRVAACGRFGYGSECLGLDDEISRDHHWGPRVDMLLPEDVYREEGPRMAQALGAVLPATFRGFKLEAGQVGGAGLSPESLPAFLSRTLGRTTPPQTYADWLDLPEEDILHVVNGEVWRDGAGEFTGLRKILQGYYPEPVWKRRIAHWCRYASGMGLYALQRAALRGNECYAYSAFGRCLKLTLELAFLLNRTYFPYDKWLYPMFLRLPHLAQELDPLIRQATSPGTSWVQRISLLEQAHDRLDARMVELGVIRPHPRFGRSKTSGYRLLEHAYGELCRTLPAEVRSHVPLWDQKYLEEFTSRYVAGLAPETWHGLLNLQPENR